MIQKLIIQTVIKLIVKQFKLDNVLKYVEEDNELDKKVREIKMKQHEQDIRLENLEKNN